MQRSHDFIDSDITRLIPIGCHNSAELLLVRQPVFLYTLLKHTTLLTDNYVNIITLGLTISQPKHFLGFYIHSDN